ncbi:MAG: hypothetical protein R6X09_08880 [Bacteroidales bacterium]
MKFPVLSLLFLSWLLPANPQSVYTHVSNTRIYDFIDELASEKLIVINSAIKPYTRTFIYEKLKEASGKKDQLNSRQQKELEHYLDYYTFGNEANYLPQKAKLNLFRKSEHTATSLQHLGLYYSDSLFNFALRPILGLNYLSNASGDYTHTYRGLEAFASVGRHFSFYADLRDNTVDHILVQPTYLTQETGGAYKGSPQVAGGADFSEMRGGIMLSWPFLQVGFVKDHPVWGNNYHGAIIQSGRTPSLPMVKLHISPVKWLDFNYFHAWLVSDVVDSSLTYLLPTGGHRDTYKNKFMAANLFTITPIEGLNISFGNSIIYSDQSVNLAYLIPVFFYKSVDHTLTSTKIVNQNSQMFADISMRLIRHTHFYLSAFWDDFAAKRVTDPDIHNFYAYKLGGMVSNWPLRNVSVTGEYFRSVPITYKHYAPTLTYESNSYNLGPYLRDNSEEIFVALDVKPLPRLYARYAYTNARHGNEYQYEDGRVAVEYPILQDNTWTQVSHSLTVSYEFFTNCHLTLEYLGSNTKGYDADEQPAQYYLDRFTPEFFQGRKNTVKVMVNIGF